MATNAKKKVPANYGSIPKPKGKTAIPGGGGRNAEGSSTGGPIKPQVAVNDPTRPALGGRKVKNPEPISGYQASKGGRK